MSPFPSGIWDMPLLTINNPEWLMAGAADGPQGLPLVQLPGTGFACSLLKFGLHGCCEVLGYQLASRLGVPVMPAVPLWCPHAFGNRGQAAGDGRIGLAVQYDEAFKDVTWEDAALRAPKTVAASLLLCLLDRYEWGQFAVTKFGLVFYDLERLFPPYCPERVCGQTWGEVSQEVSDAADAYRNIAPSEEIFDEAARLGLTELLRLAVADAATITAAELVKRFDLEPHPLAKQIEKTTADVTVMRFRHAARLLYGKTEG